MGLISDVAQGKLDFVHADDENLSDSRTWPYSKREVALNPKEEEKEQTDTEAQNNFDSDNEEM